MDYLHGPFDRAALERAKVDVAEKLIATCKPTIGVSTDVLDLGMVFSGVPGVPGMKGLKLESSEGYPLVLHRTTGVQSKAGYFSWDQTSEGNKLTGIDEDLLRVMYQHDSLRKQGLCAPSVFADCLKDTTVSLDDVLNSKTRMFSVGPLEFLLRNKQYFGLFQSALYANHIENEVAVGINADSVDWTRLAHHLSEVATDGDLSIVAGDYSAFGDTLESSCLSAVYDIINMWYAYYYKDTPNFEDHQKYREVLRDELLHVPHIALNVVYRMYCGIPSGHSLTIELDSLVNMLYVRLAWLNRFPRLPLSEYHKHCRLIVYGDDMILSLSKDIRKDFNFKTLQQFFAEHSIKYTHASKKSGVDIEWESLDEVTFLKRNFVQHPVFPRLIMGQLPLASISSSFNWTKACLDRETFFYDSARANLRFLYAHGRSQYDDVRERCMRVASELFSGHAHLPTYDEATQLIIANAL